MIFKATDYPTRKALDTAVLTAVQAGTAATDCVIQGTPLELAKKSLNETCTIYSVVVTPVFSTP